MATPSTEVQFLDDYLMAGLSSPLARIEWIHFQSLSPAGLQVARECYISNFGKPGIEITEEARSVGAALPGASAAYLSTLTSLDPDAALLAEVSQHYAACLDARVSAITDKMPITYQEIAFTVGFWTDYCEIYNLIFSFPHTTVGLRYTYHFGEYIELASTGSGIAENDLAQLVLAVSTRSDSNVQALLSNPNKPACAIVYQWFVGYVVYIENDQDLVDTINAA